MEAGRDPEEWISYDLGWKITDADIKRWRTEEEEKRRNLKRILMPKVAEPNLWVEILAMVKIIYENVRKENAAMRDIHGKKMLAEGDKIMRAFLKMSRGKMEREEAMAEAAAGIDELELMMVMVIEMRAWETSAEGRLARQMAKVKELIEESNERAKKEGR